MNLWRGLFRVWVVGSVGWALAVGAYSASEIRNPHVPPKYFAVYGPEMTLYEWTEPRAPNIEGGYNWVEFPNNVVLYAAQYYEQEKLNDWARRFSAQHVEVRDAEVRSARLAVIQGTALIILIPVLAVLLLGFCLRWVANGFRADPSVKS